MSYTSDKNNRKDDLLYHLKHGPIIVPVSLMFHLFGFEWLNTASAIVKKKISCNLAGNGKNDVRLEIQ
jgi:hypothetical protein